MVPRNERGNPKPWLGYCQGADSDWSTTWHRAQVSKKFEPEEFILNWYPNEWKKHINHESKSVSFTFQPKVAEYSEFHKTKWRSEEKARRTDKCNVMLHMTCPSWCPNCGACGVRPTFPGCGREQLPDDEEERLRSVVEQLVEMRPDIRKAAKARTHANDKALNADKALKAAEKALKAAENALEAAEKAFFPIFNGKLTKAVATAKKAFEICSEASEYASKRYDEESKKYLRVFEENMHVFPEKNLKRFAPPGYRF